MALLAGFPESALVDRSGVFHSQHHPPWFSMLIYHLRIRPLGGCSTEAYSHPIYMIIIIEHLDT
jgi:hypothetical protein